MKKFVIALLLLITSGLAACDVASDGRATPTVRPTNTPNETQIALLWTDTATATFTDTATSTLTVTPSLTATPSPTLTGTNTATFTALPTLTATTTSTNTSTNTTTATSTPSLTRTATPSLTDSPTATPSSTSTSTATPTLIPLTSTPVPPTSTSTATRTATPRIVTPDATATPSATSTQRPTSTRLPSSTPRTVTATAAATVLVTEAVDTATPLPTPTVFGFPTPTFLPRPLTSTPFGGINSGNDPFSGGPVPEANEIAFSDGTGIIRRINGEELAAGNVFDISPQGQVAFQGRDNNLYAGGSILTISPASEFGLKGNISYIDWASSGSRLAFVYHNPESEVDNGVWFYNIAENTSRQIFRDTWERRASQIDFSPDNSVILIQIKNNNGAQVGMTFLPTTWEANTEYRFHPYPYASWSTSGTSVIVSGPSVLGRVNLDAEQSFVPYDFSSSGVTYIAAATELYDGRIAFLGGPGSEGPFRLYIMPVGGPANVVSGEVAGRLDSWEWNASRTALLLIINNGGTRQVWIVQTDGSTRNITPISGAPYMARW